MSLKILVFVGMTIAFCECVNTHALFHLEPTLADIMCLHDKVEFQEVRRSVTECVQLCAVDPRCHLLIFDHGNKTCFGLKVEMFPAAESIALKDAVFYRPNTTPTAATTSATPAPGCNESIPIVEPLADSQFSASSEWDAEYTASRARLNDTSCWAAFQNSQQEYLQVEFLEPRVVTSIITRGDPVENAWVTTYQVRISIDCTTFTNITDGSGNSKIFNGNVNRRSDFENVIEPPVVTRCLRSHAIT